MKTPKPVDFVQVISYAFGCPCPYKDCEEYVEYEREGLEYQSGELIQCPYCQRFIELGEEL